MESIDILRLLGNEKIEWKPIRVGSGFMSVPACTHKSLANIATLTKHSHGEAAIVVIILASQIIDEMLQQNVKTLHNIFKQDESDKGTYSLVRLDEDDRAFLDEHRRIHFENTNEWLSEQEAHKKVFGLGRFYLENANHRDVRDFIPSGNAKATTRKAG